MLLFITKDGWGHYRAISDPGLVCNIYRFILRVISNNNNNLYQKPVQHILVRYAKILFFCLLFNTGFLNTTLSQIYRILHFIFFAVQKDFSRTLLQESPALFYVDRAVDCRESWILWFVRFEIAINLTNNWLVLFAIDLMATFFRLILS